MKDEQKEVDFYPLKLLEYFLNFMPLLLVIYGILLFDSLKIIVHKNGLFETDFLKFFNTSIIPFIILYLVVFGIIATVISSYTNILFFKIYVYTIYRFNKKNNKNNKNQKSISSLYKIALIMENNFLMDYIEKLIKEKKKIQQNYRIVYSLFISIIINLIITISNNEITVIKYIYDLYFSEIGVFTKILITLMLIPIILTIIYSIYYSITSDDTKIYFPDDKYNKLIEDIKLLNNKKSEHST